MSGLKSVSGWKQAILGLAHFIVQSEPEMLRLVLCQSHNFVNVGDAKWGPTEEFLEVKRPGEVFIHQPAQPHMMVVPGK